MPNRDEVLSRHLASGLCFANKSLSWTACRYLGHIDGVFAQACGCLDLDGVLAGQMNGATCILHSLVALSTWTRLHVKAMTSLC